MGSLNIPLQGLRKAWQVNKWQVRVSWQLCLRAGVFWEYNYWLIETPFVSLIGEREDDRACSLNWSLGRLVIGNTEIRFDASLTHCMVGISGRLKDFGVYLTFCDIQVETRNRSRDGCNCIHEML
jgi:hypothetical protein